jgi:hypothetical protein
MAILQSGNTIVDDNGLGYFSTVTVSSNGYIEIPDGGPTLSANANSFINKRGVSLNLTDAMWSWWTKPVFLRDSNASNNWTYTSFTHANGGVALAVTNHKTGNTVQYTVNSSIVCTPDDHNAGAICAGNGKVAVFIQGRNVVAPANANNMFYIQFDEGATNLVGLPVTNITFSTANTATASFYPAPFNANNNFLLLGRQQPAVTANQYLAITGEWPIANLSSPKGFFRSQLSWPYFALRRSALDKDNINFALGWHPYDSTSNHDIYYGKILANGNSAPWDVYSNNSVIGNLTTGTGLPFDELDFDKVYETNNYSFVLDGSGDYFTFPANSAFDLGTNDFTLECWVWIARNATIPSYWPQIVSIGGGTTGDANITSGAIALWIANGGGTSTVDGEIAVIANANAWRIHSGITAKTSKWTHIALVRRAGVFYLLQDGFIVGTNSTATTLSNGASAASQIGRSYNSGSFSYFPGYISNIRIVNGTALYPPANTFGGGIPSSMLTAVANTRLLTAQSRTLVDNSGNNFTITAFGDAAVSQFGPFKPDSIRLFDVHDDAVAFGTFDTTENIVQYKMAYKTGNTWSVKTVCDGGIPFHGVQVRDYYGGMSINDRNKYNVTVSTEKDNFEWEIKEYESADNGNNFTLIRSAVIPQYQVGARPMDEMRSEDAFVYDNQDTLGSAYWMGTFSGTNFTSFNTNIYSLRTLGTSAANTFIDANSKAYLASFNVSFNGNVSVVDDGLSHGYSMGGQFGPSPATLFSNYIDKFPFVSDTNASDVGDLSRAKTGAAGHSSATSGFVTGGGAITDATFFTEVESFPFAADVGGSIVNSLTVSRFIGAAVYSNSHGYMCGGTTAPVADWNVIDRYPFYSDAVGTDVGDLTTVLIGGAGHSSPTHGYVSGGGQNISPVPGYRTIQKFPFAVATTNSTAVANLGANTRVAMGVSSSTNGYTVGGFVPGAPAFYATINKFPFATDADSTNIGTLTQARRQGTGVSSTVSGYAVGGEIPPATIVNTIDKFPFATDSNATDVGDLTVARRNVAGAQG